ncbi:MAG: prepilin-type N-terminal cleavage/methylation domain-containing protein [Planctomycetota bacterium]|jgi:general secretion pathway protein G
MKTRRYKYGLSLVEMLIVLAVIALLATMVIGITDHIQTQANERSVKSTIALLEGALEEYKEFQGYFPGSIIELYSIPDCRKILAQIGDPETAVFDPWGRPLSYRYAAGDSYPELISAGPDRKFGTADDITNK